MTSLQPETQKPNSAVGEEPTSGMVKESLGQKELAHDLESQTTSLASNKDEEARVESQEEPTDRPPILNPMQDPKSFPDGGARAWLTVLGGSCCLFVSFGWINCVGVFQEYYARNQLHDYTDSEIAWIPSLQVFFMLFGGPFVGKIFDDFGYRTLLLAGTFLHVFGLMMTSISHKYYQFLLSQGVCSAIGASMVLYPAMACVTTWFFAKRGAALGLVAAGSSLGGVIFPIMVTHLISEVGFGWTMRICAFLILGLLIVANVTIRSRITPTPRPFTLVAFVRPLREPTFVLVTAAIFLFYWGMFVPFTFIVVEATTKGMSYSMANNLVPILNAASIFGRTIPNILADKKVGHFNMMIIMTLLTVVVILAIWIPVSTNAGLIVFAAAFGVASGAGIGLTPALIASISPIADIGVRTGTIFAISSVAALTGSPIGGAILGDGHGNFHGPQIFAGVSCAIGSLFFIAARVSVAGTKFKKV